MQTIRHVIWDWNGTLLDDAWLCVEVMNVVLQRRALPPLTQERYAQVFRFPVKDYYRELGFDFEQEPFELVGTEFIEGYAAREATCALRDDALEAILQVRSRGLGQSVLSASQQHRLHAQARRLGVDHRFEALVGLDDHYAAGKIEVGQRWLDQSNVNPTQTLLVGDTDHDLEVARALGVGCVLVPSGHQSRERLVRSGANVVDGLGDLANILTC